MRQYVLRQYVAACKGKVFKKKTWWVIPWCLPFPGKIMEYIPTPRPSALLNRYSDPKPLAEDPFGG